MQVRRPRSLDEALAFLEDSDEDAKIVAGGTALMLMLRAGLIFPSELIALDRLEGLDFIRIGDRDIRFGALTTLRTIERHEGLADVLPTLTQALVLVANHRVRHRATIAGNLCEADYASDPPSILKVLDCRVRTVGPRGERELNLGELLVDYYETSLDHGEIVVEVIVPRPGPSVRTTYLKYVSRTSEDRPCVGVAAAVDVDPSGRCAHLNVQVAGATAVPFGVPEVLEQTSGAVLDDELITAVSRSYAEAIEPIGDARGSADYRKHVTGILVGRALRQMKDEQENGASRL